tara:strand:- start:2433 stop:3152 length:720 start_codon:yes stop_codon:yes gene_type:complete
MAKASGLATRFFIEGADLSGDVASISGVGSSQALLDVTTLENSANARLAGLKDGTLSLNAFFDAATGKGHDVWVSNSGKMPTTDQNCLVALGNTVGDPCLMTVAKEATYYVDRPTGGPVSCTVDLSAGNGTSPDFGQLLTGGKVSDGSGTTYTAVDGAAQTTGGARAMIQAFSITSGTATVTIQDSPDNVTYGTLQAFTAVTAKSSEAIAISGTVERYVKVVTSGTFSTLVLAVAFIRL